MQEPSTQRQGTEPVGHNGLRLVLFLLGGTSVASLLSWVYGLGSFRLWFLLVSVPGQVALVGIAWFVARRERYADLHRLLVAGAMGGLLGTLGYDLFRVPFVLVGLRVLAPIDSYGVLAAGASSSSAWTGLLGWSYHVANGVGFGIAWAMLGPRRDWRWGIGWALVLESATIITPFATLYALRGTPTGTNWTSISIAYAAHIPYGVAIGLAVAQPRRVADFLATIGRRAVPATFVAVLAALLVWQAPWRSTDADLGRRVAPGASAVVVDARFEPEWLRVPVGDCLLLDNRDEVAHTAVLAGSSVQLDPGRTEVCPGESGVFRVKLDDQPWSGGFVIVDAQP